MTRDPRWPFPYGLLLALAVSVLLWLAIVAAGQWALSLAMNIMGAK